MDKYVDSFNHKVGSGYDIQRANSILRCYRENKMEYYPLGYNKYDWLFTILCKELTNIENRKYPNIDIPNIMFSPSFYGFIILDVFKAVTYDDIFQIIRYRLNLNSLQVKYMSRCTSLQPLVMELMEYRSRYSGNNHIFNNLTCKRSNTMDIVDIELKSMKIGD